ncbi:beta,beta-carotene 15,15'-dioxygenase-like [Antedon mediterranea]|uniref:beta,beta-carotene 15,15'-dioxygenase-like n=1 Tax=Antedon mediterranea TaxID=105859 RepID=UPI003AF8712A
MAEKDPHFARLFESTVKEQIEPVETKIKGNIPKWIKGTMIRNGPGLFEVGDDTYKHWFDGLSLLHRFNLNNGKVTYQSRFLQSEAYKRAMKYKRIVMTEFGTLGIPDPCKNIFERFASQFLPLNITDNDVINFMKIGDDLYTLTETQYIRKIDTEDLTSSENRVDLFRTFAVLTQSSHPHVDVDGCTYNMASSYLLGCYYNIVKFTPNTGPDPTSTAEIVCRIPATRWTKPSYYHSFGMTTNYFIFLEQSLYIDIPRLAISTMCRKPIASSLFYDKHEPVRFHLVNRSDGSIVKTQYVSDPMFGMHVINSYEQDGHVIFDMCCYGDGYLISKFYLDYLRNGDENGKTEFPSPELRRYVLPLNINSWTPRDSNLVTLKNSKATARLQKNGQVYLVPECMSEIGIDMPCINYKKYNAKPYRYAYGTSNVPAGGFVDAMAKIDLHTKESKIWQEPNCYPSEPMFIESPDAVDEDDGVILSCIVNSEHRSAFLLVLDAKTFKEIGRAQLPDNIECGLTFHGHFEKCS